MSSYYRQQLEKYLKTLEIKTDFVLDIGGSQLPVNKRTKSWDVGQYKTLDLEVPHKGDIPDIVCDLNEAHLTQHSYFNVVFCLEVMEYIYNPVNALKIMNKYLLQGGVLYISFPFVYNIHPPKGQDYLRYTPDGAEKLLKEAGFEIIEHIPRLSPTGLLPKFYEQDQMRGIDNNINNNVIGSIIKAIKI